MKWKLSLTLAQLLFTYITSECFVRREWREHSSAEQKLLLDTINKLKETPSTDGNENRYDDFAVLHMNFGRHNTAGKFLILLNTKGFLPWHRLFTRKFEMELQLISPGILLPYWDYSLDSQSPEESTVWKDGFGSLGDSDTCCVTDGKFAGWIASDRECLKRSGEVSVVHYLTLIENNCCVLQPRANICIDPRYKHA